MAEEPEAPLLYCDESGSTGETLLDPQQRVFVHASVHATAEDAADSIDRLRNRARSAGSELKGASLLARNRQAVEAWLDQDQLFHHAQVLIHVTEKNYFIVSKFVSLVLEEHLDAQGWPPGPDLNRDFAFLLGGALKHLLSEEERQAFLGDFVAIARSMARNARRPGPEGIVRLLGTILCRAEGSPFTTVLALAVESRAQLELLPGEQNSDFRYALDPLLPALVAILTEWCALNKGQDIVVVHDRRHIVESPAYRQMFYSAGRLAGLWHGAQNSASVVDFSSADSKLEKGIQVADVLAAAARVAAEEVLRDGEASPLGGLVGPWLSPSGGMWTPGGELHNWWVFHHALSSETP